MVHRNNGFFKYFCWSSNAGTDNDAIPVRRLYYFLTLVYTLYCPFRIVDVDLKTLCAGVTSLLIFGLGFLPAPVFIGII